MTEEIDIKETKELLKAIEILGVTGLEAAKDGISADDALVIVTKLATNYKAILDGFTGLEKIKAELEDLDKSEVIEIIGAIYELVAAGERAARDQE